MNHLSRILTDRRLAILVILGFSSGLPIALVGTGGTFQAWLTDSNISVQTLGNLSVIMLPYAFKFLWAPLLDRYNAPIFGGRGYRQGWMILTQLLIALLLISMSIVNPTSNIMLLAILAFLTAFVSASQDIAIDAYRTEVLEEHELGIGASAAIIGYRLGMLTSGALALYFGEIMSWSTVYILMALAQCVGVIASLLAPTPRRLVHRPTNLSEAVISPLSEFIVRRGAIELLLFILLYKLGDVMAAMFTTRFMLDLGFQKSQIAQVVKGFGLVATIVGSIIGGIMYAKAGLQRALIFLGIIQAASILTFSLLAMQGKDLTFMVIAITCENLGSGLGTAAFTGFLMRLCNRRFTGTQYALFTSIAGLTRSSLGGLCGYLATNLGWAPYFTLSAAVSIPAILMAIWGFQRWHFPELEATLDRKS